jgi:hypothetical protein
VLWTPPPFPGTRQSNASVVGAGTSVSASGTANTKGSWTQLIASTTDAAFGIFVILNAVAEQELVRNILVDIGIGAAGSEVVLLPDLHAGFAAHLRTGTQVADTSVLSPGCKSAFFPIFVPSGSRLAARAAASLASDTVDVHLILWGKTPQPMWVGSRVDAYGVVSASSRGTAVNAGNNAEGAWAQLVASTSLDHQAWVLMGGNRDTGGYATAGETYSFDLGVGAAGSEQIIGENWIFGVSKHSAITGPFPPLPVYAPVPAGSRIAARAASTAAAVTTVDAIAYGIS